MRDGRGLVAGRAGGGLHVPDAQAGAALPRQAGGGGERARPGLAARLVGIACERAAAQGFPVVELQTRIELVENHAAFARMGFVKTGESSHEGYDRVTTLTMQRPVSLDRASG
ncbi:hypothetical protein ACFSZS_11105 [Seohaeicola zhoushanensis]